MIRADRIDILVDLTLHMAGNRLRVFAQKPAPIQVTWLGYPGTTGLEAMDYRLTDPYLDPPGEEAPHIHAGLRGGAFGLPPDRYYSEQSIRLPETFWCYDPDALDLVPPTGALPALAGNPFTFGALNNFCKASRGTLRLWVRAAAVPGSRLLMLAPPGPHRQRVLDIFAEGGIAAGCIEFIEFQPRTKYLATYGKIDLALDAALQRPHHQFGCSVDGRSRADAGGIYRRGGRAGWSQHCNLGLSEFAAARRSNSSAWPSIGRKICPPWLNFAPRFASACAARRSWMRHALPGISRRSMANCGKAGGKPKAGLPDPPHCRLRHRPGHAPIRANAGTSTGD